MEGSLSPQVVQGEVKVSGSKHLREEVSEMFWGGSWILMGLVCVWINMYHFIGLHT